MYYKILKEDGSTYHGQGKWNLPKGKRPGKWMPRIDNLEMCRSGYHLATEFGLISWLGTTIYEVEWRGRILEQEDKICVSQARLIRKLPWDERIARLFACDCAQRSLKIFEKYYPKDKRPRQAIQTARKFANGKATEQQLNAAWDAARAAARNAAWDAAWAAARDAAGAAARNAAWDAAGAAAWAAAGAAAEAAAWAAAWDAEHRWQTKRLLKYLRGDFPK